MKSALLKSASPAGIAGCFVVLIVAAVTAAGVAISPSAEETVVAADPVLESFGRDMHREPTPSAPARRDLIDRDALYEVINTSQWTQDKSTNADDSKIIGRNEDEDTNNDS